jgi:monoglucosyldiacylglycerol epimerase
MLASIPITPAELFRTLLQSAGLFVLATFVFDTIHFSLHHGLKSRFRWLRGLSRPHLAHHVFFDRRLRYHKEAAVRNLLHHVIPEYAA